MNEPTGTESVAAAYIEAVPLGHEKERGNE